MIRPTCTLDVRRRAGAKVTVAAPIRMGLPAIELPWFIICGSHTGSPVLPALDRAPPPGWGQNPFAQRVQADEIAVDARVARLQPFFYACVACLGSPILQRPTFMTCDAH